MKKICVITGSRADYGLLKNLISIIKKDNHTNLQLFVTGSHLSKEFGNTYKEILSDKFKITKKIDIKLNNDTPISICNSMSIGLKLFSIAFQKHKPDILVILGDRYELLVAATAALIHNIPIAHLHGGEKTIGAFDDAIRHSITKMSHLHFTTCEIYKKRVIQLGEDKNYVFNVGGFGNEAMKKINLIDYQNIEKNLKFKFYKFNLLITFHSVTNEKLSSEKYIKELLLALSKFNKIRLIFTLSNADTDGRIINKLIKNFTNKNSNAIYFESLGQTYYYSILKNVDAVVGNSSSGILEAPTYRVPTINIGDRQKGRVMAKSIININPLKSEICLAIKKIYNKKFRLAIKSTKSPYDKKNTSLKVFQIIKKMRKIDLKKDFVDSIN